MDLTNSVLIERGLDWMGGWRILINRCSFLVSRLKNIFNLNWLDLNSCKLVYCILPLRNFKIKVIQIKYLWKIRNNEICINGYVGLKSMWDGLISSLKSGWYALISSEVNDEVECLMIKKYLFEHESWFWKESGF